MTDNPASEIAEIRARHERDAKNFRLGAEMTWQGQKQIHTDRATLLAEVERLTAQLAKSRKATVEHQFAVKYAWLRSEAILRGAFKSGIEIDAEYDRALSTGERKGITPSTKVDSRGYHTSHKHLLYADQSEVTTLCRDCGLEGVYLCKPCKPALSTGEPK